MLEKSKLERIYEIELEKLAKKDFGVARMDDMQQFWLETLLHIIGDVDDAQKKIFEDLEAYRKKMNTK